MASAVMFSLFFMSGARAESTIYYVTVSGGGTQDGSSWTNAFSAASLDHAIELCSNDVTKDEVRVAKGLYTRTETLILPKGVKLTGGWDTSSESREIDAMMANPMTESSATILSRDASLPLAAKFSIVTGGIEAASDDTLLDGFTVTGGTGTKRTDYDYDGGGMYNSGSSPAVANCTFIKNVVTGLGGAMENVGYSSTAVTNCSFRENSANQGGGMDNRNYGSPTVTNCTFSKNLASIAGGIHNYNSSSVITNCTFSENDVTLLGGGIANYLGTPVIKNCTFTGNTAEVDGGGISNYKDCSPIVTNCTFSFNKAGIGGGMSNASSYPTVTNCTFSENDAESGGGMYSHENSYPTVVNSILWGNKANGSGDDVCEVEVSEGAKSIVTIRNSIVGVSSGDINTDSTVLSGSPKLISVDKNMNAAANSADVYIYKISGDSAALGEGLYIGTHQLYNGIASVDITVPSSDQRGEARRVNYVDLGAYQYALTESLEVYGITLSNTSAELELGQSVSFDVTEVKPINFTKLSLPASDYADITSSDRTITLTAKAETDGAAIPISAVYNNGSGTAGDKVTTANFTLKVFVTTVTVANGETLIISEDTTMKALEIKAGGTVTVSGDVTLTITGAMTAEEGSYINLTGKAAILVGGIAAGSPKVTVTGSDKINIEAGEGSTITYPEAVINGDKYPSGLVIATEQSASSQDIADCSLDEYVAPNGTIGYFPNISPASFDEQMNVKFSDIKGLKVVHAKSTEQDAGKIFLLSFNVTSADIPASADKAGVLRIGKLTNEGKYAELERVKALNLLDDGKWLIKSGGKVLSASDIISGDEFEINIAVKDNGIYDSSPNSNDVVDPAVLFYDGTYKDDPKQGTHGGGSSGCNAGFAASLVLLIPIILRKKK